MNIDQGAAAQLLLDRGVPAFEPTLRSQAPGGRIYSNIVPYSHLYNGLCTQRRREQLRAKAHLETFAVPAMADIASELKRRHPSVPLMVFPRGACYALPALQNAGYDVVTADCATDLVEAREALKTASRGRALDLRPKSGLEVCGRDIQ